MYIDQNKRYEDTKSTAWSFTIVGVCGLLFLVLAHFNLLPVSLDSNVMMPFVLSLLCIIFLVIGIKSFLSLKTIQQNAASQDSENKEIKEWFLGTYMEKLLSRYPVSDSSSEKEELFFQRYQVISDTIAKEYPKLKEEDVEHLAEEIYSEIFNAD